MLRAEPHCVRYCKHIIRDSYCSLASMQVSDSKVNIYYLAKIVHVYTILT